MSVHRHQFSCNFMEFLGNDVERKMLNVDGVRWCGGWGLEGRFAQRIRSSVDEYLTKG